MHIYVIDWRMHACMHTLYLYKYNNFVFTYIQTYMCTYRHTCAYILTHLPKYISFELYLFKFYKILDSRVQIHTRQFVQIFSYYIYCMIQCIIKLIEIFAFRLQVIMMYKQWLVSFVIAGQNLKLSQETTGFTL